MNKNNSLSQIDVKTPTNTVGMELDDKMEVEIAYLEIGGLLLACFVNVMV